MPYGDDHVLQVASQMHAENVRRVKRQNDEYLRNRLRSEFNVPAEFEDLAVEIWYAGKED